MKPTIDVLMKHKHLIVISIMSAILVTSLQFIVGILTNNKPTSTIALHLEDITASIVSFRQDEPKDQFMSILTDSEIREFLGTDVVEDVAITQAIPVQDISFERLFVSFDDQNEAQGSNGLLEKRISVNVGSGGIYGVSLCAQSQRSCTHPMTSRSAEVIPVQVKYVQDDPSKPGTLVFTTTSYPGTYQGSFISSPLIFSVYAM